MAAIKEFKDEVVIRFAGDSGDGMQLTGSQFSGTTALMGNDLGTFPDFPAEIRAPQGTTAGVSGYQLHFGSVEIFTPGDLCDVLVAMNSAALKVNLRYVKKGGIIIVNLDGFDSKNLKLAEYPENKNPLEDGTLSDFVVFKIDISKLTQACLADLGLSSKEIDRSKNMFVLGFLYWLYNRTMDSTITHLKKKFASKPTIADANIKTLQAGWNYGETTDSFTTRYEVKPAKLEPGIYRNIMGNEATALGLIIASKLAGLDLFLGSYPITPASDILHELSKHKNFKVKTFQAEDEIAAICSTIGASFTGCLGVTTTSGPGMALKTEAMGLAVMLELPLIVCNVQRGGPSTGLPTKTEQADLLQAVYGRNGECPIPVISANSPSDCFETVIMAAKIAVEHMTPVIFLSDGYIANGSEPWKFPKINELPKITIKLQTEFNNGDKYLPYTRDEKLSRPWAVPGTKGLEHRIGGLEKQHLTGNVCYEPENHEFMVKLRAEKVEKIADYIPLQTMDSGASKGKLLVLGWGSTYGTIKTAIKELTNEGHTLSHTHIRYISPFPKNLGEILYSFDKVLIPEINNGQLIKLIREKYLIPAIGFNKIQGLPFTVGEMKKRILETLNS